jgi:hypothetical protein
MRSLPQPRGVTLRSPDTEIRHFGGCERETSFGKLTKQRYDKLCKRPEIMVRNVSTVYNDVAVPYQEALVIIGYCQDTAAGR